jgi:transcriptional regulator with XRE-family HTH domain
MSFNLAQLRQAFAESGFTLGDLSSRVGKDKATVSRYLNGKVPMTVDMLDAIADALGVPVTRFYDKEDAARTPEERAALLMIRQLPPDALKAQLALWSASLPKAES